MTHKIDEKELDEFLNKIKMIEIKFDDLQIDFTDAVEFAKKKSSTGKKI
jgi:hypothetical protein